MTGTSLNASRAGCRQIVVLGAGMDARAFRLPLHPTARSYEIDTAPVLNFKAKVLARNASSRLSGAYRSTPTCGTTGWARSRAAGFGPAPNHGLAAEGLLMYFTASQANALLAAITAMSAPGNARSAGGE